ncbi:MAG TPA: hypothetical protein VFV66_15495 [Nonomuraea sp.]|nr:hypothetical protein [Nonomuraea sp.]
MKRTSSVTRLPLDALSLAVRHLLPLAFFFTAGRVVHDLILVMAVYVSDVEPPGKFVGFAVMSLAVLATLTSYIAMLRLLRHDGPPAPATETEGERVPRLIAHTLLPFLAFYGAWGLFSEDVRQYSVLSQQLFGVEQVRNLEFNPLVATTVIALAAFAVKVVLEKSYERARKGWLGLLATVFESMWMFFAVVSVEEVISGAAGWVTSRAAWAGAGDALGGVLSPVGDAVAFVLPDPRDAILLPLVWLAIAAVVFGRQAGDVGAAIAGTRVESRATRLWAATPAPVRGVAEFVSRDLRGKYLPALDGLRLALRVGPVFFLTFCLCHVALTTAADWTFIGVTHLVGPHETAWWTLWHDPIKFGVTAVFEVLRISLLAATLRLALQAAPAGRSRPRRPAGSPPAAS